MLSVWLVNEGDKMLENERKFNMFDYEDGNIFYRLTLRESTSVYLAFFSLFTVNFQNLKAKY